MLQFQQSYKTKVSKQMIARCKGKFFTLLDDFLLMPLFTGCYSAWWDRILDALGYENSTKDIPPREPIKSHTY